MRRLALAALAALFACNDGEGQQSGFSTSITTAPVGSTTSGESPVDSTTSTASSSGPAASSEASGGSTGSMSTGSGLPDLGPIPDAGDGPPPGCKGKVDLLFTISSHPTMEIKQARLKASFPGFIATLESAFADFDYHIMSSNTSGFWGYPSCVGCKDVCADLPEYPCGTSPEPCDSIRGAGVTYPLGEHASNERCELASGLRYITAGQPMLEEAFTCVASMGINGADGVAETTMLALADELDGPGGCNEGFLRDDALLVVVAIQDTYDEGSEGTAEDWRDALVEAKGGDADAVVLLVISTDIDDPVGLCGYDPGVEHELRTWTELMQPNALFGSICAEGYSDYFAAAAEMIKSQCDVFVPQ
ncbi:hypothetical protein SAMN02745121_08188 [Nannocystis exedens]|uniref:Uncharacterized protein n=1 Tax=Nannocystis exedens TaxID=54 RepID=A0A1I2HT42_9BACT|nr:hypothetical protein [Nannocystis exedens]PCC69876.1 hypothetical protein NAEX_02903 [Nannocystis exedens]SFF32882.1 hypothetical protein SAMN02745121_08188 [Nannocystis exedens]